MVDEEPSLEAPVPMRVVRAVEDKTALPVVLTGTSDETPVPIGAEGPAEAVLVVPLP